MKTCPFALPDAASSTVVLTLGASLVLSPSFSLTDLLVLEYFHFYQLTIIYNLGLFLAPPLFSSIVVGFPLTLVSFNDTKRTLSRIFFIANCL